MTIVSDVVARLRADTGDFESGLKRAEGAVHGFEASLEAGAEHLTRFKEAAGLVAVGIGGLLFEGLAKAKDAMMEVNAANDSARIKFTNLLGSVEAANAEMRRTAEFATKFGLPTAQVQEAARQLQIMTHGALDTTKSLEGMANAAAQTGEPIGQIARQLGFMYTRMGTMEGGVDGLSAGFSRYARQLVMSGVLQQSTVTQLGTMAKAAAPVKDMWALVEKDMARFNGTAAAQADTLAGVKQSFHNLITEGVGEGLRPIYEGLTHVMKAMRDLAQSDTGKQMFELIHQAAVNLVEPLNKLAQHIEHFAAVAHSAGIEGLVHHFRDMESVLGLLAGAMAGFGTDFLDKLPILNRFLRPLGELLGGMRGPLLGLVLGTKESRDALLSFIASLGHLFASLSAGEGVFVKMTASLGSIIAGFLHAATAIVQFASHHPLLLQFVATTLLIVEAFKVVASTFSAVTSALSTVATIIRSVVQGEEALTTVRVANAQATATATVADEALRAARVDLAVATAAEQSADLSAAQGHVVEMEGALAAAQADRALAAARVQAAEGAAGMTASATALGPAVGIAGVAMVLFALKARDTAKATKEATAAVQAFEERIAGLTTVQKLAAVKTQIEAIQKQLDKVPSRSHEMGIGSLFTGAPKPGAPQHDAAREKLQKELGTLKAMEHDLVVQQKELNAAIEGSSGPLKDMAVNTVVVTDAERAKIAVLYASEKADKETLKHLQEHKAEVDNAHQMRAAAEAITQAKKDQVKAQDQLNAGLADFHRLSADPMAVVDPYESLLLSARHLKGEVPILTAEFEAQAIPLAAMKRDLDALRLTYDTLTRQSNALQIAIAHLQETVNRPLAGTGAFNDALHANQLAQDQVKLQIAKLMGAGHFSQEPAIRDLNAALAKLQNQADQLNLNHALDLGDKEYQLKKLADTSKEIGFDEAKTAAVNLGLMKDQEKGVKDQLDILKPKIDETSAAYDKQKTRVDLLAGALGQVVSGMVAVEAADKAMTSAIQSQGDAVMAHTIETTSKAISDTQTSIKAMLDATGAGIESFLGEYGVELKTPTSGGTFASGGSTEKGVTGHFAAGGIFEDHTAHIARTMRVFAEPETGGEAYIPLAASKRARSANVLADVAGRFGMQVLPMATGGVLPPLTGDPYGPSMLGAVARAVMRGTYGGADAALQGMNLVRSATANAMKGPQQITSASGVAFTFTPSAMATSTTGAMGPMGPVPSGSVTDWLNSAIALTRTPTSWLSPLYQIAMHESGGNPRSLNTHDPVGNGTFQTVAGLMNMLASTFRAHALPGHGDIMNPIDNAASAIEYIIGRYGTPFNTPGVRALAAGKHYVGYDSGGWLQPGLTMAYNGTGRPERILGPNESSHSVIVANGAVQVNVTIGARDDADEIIRKVDDRVHAAFDLLLVSLRGQG